MNPIELVETFTPIESLEASGRVVPLRQEPSLEPGPLSENPEGTETVAQLIRPETSLEPPLSCDLAPASLLTCAVVLNLERLGVRQLKHLAKWHQLKGYHSLNKAELISLLQGA